MPPQVQAGSALCALYALNNFMLTMIPLFDIIITVYR